MASNAGKPTLQFAQVSFAGGMNQQVDATRIGPNEYPLLINGRTRYGNVEPITKPVTADPQGSLPSGIKQGIYAAGNYLVVFVAGKAYYRNFLSANAAFQPVNGGYRLSAVAETIWAELVPASTANFKRVPESDNKNDGVNLTTAVSGSPQCLVCQDGSSDPLLVFDDGSSRKAQNYTEWSLDQREYVPIGRMMLYHNGILYIAATVISPDAISGNNITSQVIYRSVTGRPLDFMVSIAYPSGDKAGDALSVAHSIDYDEITCLSRTGSTEGNFYAATAKNSYLVRPVLDRGTLFNEPKFDNTFMFNTGPLNNFSIADVSGSSALIDQGGIRSFNAILQTKNEGKNEPFYARIALLFADITQDVTAASEFDDYTLFAVNTRFGRGVLVFDKITGVFASLDLFEDIPSAIKQFAVVRTGAGRRIFFLTTNGEVMEAYPAIAENSEYETVQLYVGEWCSNEPKVEQRPELFKLVFTDVVGGGDVTVKTFVDQRLNSNGTITKALEANVSSILPPLAVPFGSPANDVVTSLSFPLDQSADQGWKIGFLISWNFQASLSHITAYSAPVIAINSDQEAATLFNT